MAEFIVIRLTPATPVDAATFTNYLNGLTINVYDISFANPKAGSPGDPTLPKGSATYPAGGPNFVPFPAPLPPPPIVNYPPGTTIVQHFTPQVVGLVIFGVTMESVATAVIPYVAPAGAEYPSTNPAPDLRIQFQRGGAQTVIDPNLYYDVTLYSAGVAPAPEDYQFLPDASVSAYVALPAALDPNLAQVQLPTDGNPPNYDVLLAAVNNVLAADPGSGLSALISASGPLSVEQCRNIAYEIFWGSEPSLPSPPAGLETMYTDPPNTGTLTDPNEENRLKFEGELKSFYATRNAQAELLTKFVFALAAAIWCELQSKAATSAIIQFPVNPGATTKLATVSEAEVILTGALGIDIPAEYFYVLGAQLPVQVTPAQRFKMACGADQGQNLTQLTSAVDVDVITVPPTAPQPSVNPAQAVRILTALAVPPASSAAQCPVTSVTAVWNDWLAYPVTAPPPDNWRSYKPGDDFTEFWPTEAAKVAPGVQAAFLELVLYALTQGYVIANSGPPVSLADYIAQNLSVHAPGPPGALLFSPVATVQQVAQALPSDWQSFFTNSPPPPGALRIDLLPPFTLPGTPDVRIAAFIRYVRKFFDMPSTAAAVTVAPANAPPTLQLPTTFDPIQSFVTSYGGGFVFGTPLVDATVKAAVGSVFPGDLAAQSWLEGTIRALNDLCRLAIVPANVNPLKPSPEFSVAEALYARGFTSVADVLALSQTDFQNALRGTVAFDQAATLYAKAQTIGPPPAIAPAGPGGPFRPVNPGSLTNCIPPCYLSPLGPVEYLHELLKLSEASTCDDPFPFSENTLEAAIDNRRGPLGSLQVTRANLETPLPLIDIVNECLEYMGATTPPTIRGTAYNTSNDILAGYKLCTEECCHENGERGIAGKHEKDEDEEGEDQKGKNETLECHDPVNLFGALPEHSTPATPTPENSAVEPTVFNNLRNDFSSCCLPYSQALDVSRVYLEHFCTSRFEVMRTFRKCITEFVLDPEHEPAGFQDHLWRYPVRTDIAIEYLCITPEEYTHLFGGVWPECSGSQNPTPPRDGHRDEPLHWQLYGFASATVNDIEWTSIVVQLPEFLKRTCLSYCEFLELWKCGFVSFRNGLDESGEFPDCEPCCEYWLSLTFPEEPDVDLALYQLAVFIRLWRKLKGCCRKSYSFFELADICNALRLFVSGTINPDFMRQLAAFQMLLDQYGLRLVDRRDTLAPGLTGADRTHLLALWVGPAAHKWGWAVHHLLERIQHHARARHKCTHRRPEFVKLLTDSLDPLSHLAGFDPTSATDNWHSAPTHTLRFAEVLAKIYVSNFGVGEILYLFTADPHIDGDDPFLLQEGNEALDSPLGLPDDEHKYSLWQLRQKLLEAHVSDADVSDWTWERIEQVLREDLGYTTSVLISLGEHFFPDVLTSAGNPVSSASRQYSTNLPAASTAPLMWNTPPEGPFKYDSTSQTLWMQLPLVDEEVIEQFTHLRSLNAQERQAVQDLYFAPRQTLAAFALLFGDLSEAQRHLIERHEGERWAYFQRQFALCHERRRILAEHLAEHVAFATGQERPDSKHVALLLSRELLADENLAKAPWETDAGHAPAVTWTPPPNGGAFAALLGLTGTGLLGEYTPQGGTLAWRDVSGPMSAFGRERNFRNCPVPTVVPAMDLTLPSEQLHFVTVLNGLGMKNANDAWLGGAQGFTVKWTGALLIDDEGTYEFSAGHPTPDGEKPDQEGCEHRSWRVILKRGQRTWILLTHRWHEEHDEHDEHERHEEHEEDDDALSCLPLKRGAYELTIEFTQPSPLFLSDDQSWPQHTGFQLKYAGPDTHDQLIAVPHHQLFRVSKDKTLDDGIANLSAVAASFLNQYYTSSLRDIRRTYQRAFKALLFAHRFGLSGKRWSDHRSELGYMLAQKQKFAGFSYYRSGGAFVRHAADFDFNFLPLRDDYYPPAALQDSRVQPSSQRSQAMFDWWERIFDYTRVRRDVECDCDRHLWLLFDEAEDKQPADPAYLLRHMCADARHWQLDLHYYQDQNSPPYAVTSNDLEDDRWVVRAWHADEWIRRLLRFFCAKDITKARPDLWASDDPSALTGPVGSKEAETGNANLSEFLCDGCFENGQPCRYEDVKRLNDCLRDRARDALLAYLCTMDRVTLPWGSALQPQYAESPKDLSNLLLLDVESGICERASRIEEAITAVQSFIRRARLGLETGWTITYDFAQLWDRRFATFKIWEACRCRELYKENWIDWDELHEAKKVEGFRFLESELRSSTLTVAVPGGLEYWPDQLPPNHPGIALLQIRDASSLQKLPPIPPSPPNQTREGLGLLGTPEHDARPSWLAALSDQQLPVPGGRAGVPVVPASGALPPSGNGPLPFWIEAAIRLGVRFYRIAAGGLPPAAALFKPRKFHSEQGCCAECGCIHPMGVDEYYFWLLDARFFKAVDAKDSPSFSSFQQDDYYDPTSQESTRWHDNTQVPNLLEWKSSPIVRLGWCRVHNGEFKQPRRSYEGVQVTSGGALPDLTFVGRVADSLVFQVTNAITPTGYAGSDAPGFRYDLASDAAVVLPLVVDPPPSASTYPAGLPAYPYFAYVEPGASVFPPSLYSPALAVACALRTHCRFEDALKWYELVFNPLKQDDTWIHCPPETRVPTRGKDTPVLAAAVPPRPTEGGDGEDENGKESDNECCDTTNVSDQVALNRSILMHYLDTLLDWGDSLMRRHSPEAFQQARLIFDTAAMILGKRPRAVIVQEPPISQKVSDLIPLVPPLNPRLLKLYCHTEERLALIHHCLDAYRLINDRPKLDMPYWGEDPCCGCQISSEPCLDECRIAPCVDDGEWCYLHSPYRFLFLVQKAQEIASMVRELGAALLAAFEKGDAEYLVSLRAGHEVELLNLTRSVRQDQWREADWQRQALQKTKEVTQTNRRYYATLIQNGLNSGELQYEDLIGVSLATHTAANVIEGIAEAMDLIPDLFVGFPCEETWLPLGTKLSGMFKTIARITNMVADMASSTASLELTEAGWARRLDEWVHQVEVLDIEVQQIERQILAAERRRAQALQELNNQQRQIEQSKEVQEFLRDKFTSQELYLFLQKETASLHYRMYELALHTARQAERAFNFERGNTARKFIPCESWDNLHAGLLAGERLQLALRTMEKEYLDLNVREYELTKHISLRLHFPLQFLHLKTTGYCEVELPEWLFDLDHPGQYMRRIKNVTLTIPCVTGPYTGVHCRLTLLSSKTRVDPCLTCPPARCCGKCKCDNEYELCHCDPRAIKHYGAKEAIATSSGQSDGGMFELTFRDERYLPFEFLGAISRWRIELPPENNFFDMDTLSDVILNLNYTAREGGELLRRAANQVAQCHIRHGWSLFDVRHEFPDAWQLFRNACRNHREWERTETERREDERREGEHEKGNVERENGEKVEHPEGERGEAERREWEHRERERKLTLELGRRLFPYLPCDREVKVTRVVLMFETPETRERACCKKELVCCDEHKRSANSCDCRSDEHDLHCKAYACCDCEGCCCNECVPACQTIEFTPHSHDRDNADGECECEETDVRCMASAEWPGFYHGLVETALGPLGHDGQRRRASFEFPPAIGEISRVFLLCYYEVSSLCDDTEHGNIRERPWRSASGWGDDKTGFVASDDRQGRVRKQPGNKRSGTSDNFQSDERRNQ